MMMLELLQMVNHKWRHEGCLYVCLQCGEEAEHARVDKDCHAGGCFLSDIATRELMIEIRMLRRELAKRG